MEREDGEMSDEEAMVVEDNKRNVIYEQSDHTVLYQAKKSGLVVKTLEKVDAIKLDERAKRFGLNLTGNRIITQKQIDELYLNFGIESENERHFRFDTLHLSGVDGLTTKEIFEYLEDFKPVSLEWIDSNSCNVVCQDHITAALALLVHSREIRNEEIRSMISQSSTYHWREGMPHEKKDFIIMRFATKSDKKDSTKKTKSLPKISEHIDVNLDQSMDPIYKNPWGDLCQSWGVYDHQEIWNRKVLSDTVEQDIPTKQRLIKKSSLAKRLGKRNYESENSDSSNSDSEWTRKQKAPRMRMHADDEETKRNRKLIAPVARPAEKETFAPLSIEVVNTHSTYSPKNVSKLSDKFRSHDKKLTNTQKDQISVHSRLGSKVTPDEVLTSDDNSDMSDYYVMSSVQKVGKKSKSDVWSRLDINTDEMDKQNDLRQILKSRQPRESKEDNDLRSRIKSREGISLRVEIDNDYHKK